MVNIGKYALVGATAVGSITALGLGGYTGIERGLQAFQDAKTFLDISVFNVYIYALSTGTFFGTAGCVTGAISGALAGSAAGGLVGLVTGAIKHSKEKS